MSELAWYHCILTTYGTWLPGDPRGFRTRHHREHIEGDYKAPPPAGLHDVRHARSQKLMQFSAIQLAVEERALLGAAALEFLRPKCETVLSIAVSGQHFHLQFRCQRSVVIATLGELKRHLWYVRRQNAGGKRLWGKGRKIVPIRSREHQRRVFNYIMDHASQGAWVWSYRDAQ